LFIYYTYTEMHGHQNVKKKKAEDVLGQGAAEDIWS